MNPYRYPGVKPFETKEQDHFFGRDRDIADLYSLILLEKLCVLFGKSGYGKSSLLNAGIIPLFLKEREEASFHPLVVRLGAPVKGQEIFPADSVRQRLNESFPLSVQNQFLDDLLPEPSLWKAFKQCQAAGGPRRFVLIFDQFEEFFYYPPDARQQFKEQLAELLYQDSPQAVRELAGTLSRADRLLIATPLEVKAVFAIREDRLSLLDSLKDALPAILHKRYELKALSREQAREAIVKPAALKGEFVSSPFRYDPVALNAILEELSRSQGQAIPHIEAFLLQILCQYLEMQVIARKATDIVIKPTDLPPMTNLVEDYFEQRIDRLPVAMQTAARRLLEALVFMDTDTGMGRRLALDGDLLLAEYRKEGATPALLQELENTFLLRREANAFGGYNYEVSHDTLIGTIQKAKKTRLEMEQKVEEQRQKEELKKAKEQAEIEGKLRTQAEQARRDAEKQRKLAEGSQKDAESRRKQAEEAKNEAEVQKLAAIEAKELAIDSERRAKRNLRNAGIAAFVGIALALIAGVFFIQAQRERAKALDELTKRERLEIQEYLQKAQNFRNSKDFDLALKFYQYVKDSLFVKPVHSAHEKRREVEQYIQLCQDSLKLR
jgi:hypothetical protein